MDTRMGVTGDDAGVLDTLRDYYAASNKHDLTAMLSYYHEPVTFITTQGVVSRSTHADMMPMLTQFFERLKLIGAARSEWADAHVKLLSDVLAIASIIVVRYSVDGHEVQRVGWTYLLHSTGGSWKIAVLAAHPANNVLRL